MRWDVSPARSPPSQAQRASYHNVQGAAPEESGGRRRGPIVNAGRLCYTVMVQNAGTDPIIRGARKGEIGPPTESRASRRRCEASGAYASRVSFIKFAAREINCKSV